MALYDKASLVLIPSGTKEGVIFSQKPTNGDGDFTFSRSTAATRVNADGLIEKETQNLLLQSNTFDTTWLDITLTKTSGQSGYDGTNDAWELECNAASSRLYQPSLSVSGVQTYSVYAKAGTLDYMGLIVAGAGAYAYFDIANGQLGATNVSTIDHKIESIGGGWYRCSIAYTGTTTAVRIYPAQADNDTAQTSGSIYIQDAQLEEGLVARDYIETTTTAVYGGITDNVPRLDYTDSSCPALLLEGQRTNLVTQSEYLDAVFVPTNITQTTNYGTSPDGNLTSTRIQLDNLTDSRTVETFTGIVTSGVTYTFSCYYKGINGETTYMYFLDGNGITSVSKKITFNGEWQRESITFEAGTASNYTYIVDARQGTSTATDFEVWGAQLEEGSYATSYIPTYGTSVTRNSDVCNNAGNASTFNDSEGVLYAEIAALADDGTFRNISLNNGTTAQAVRIYYRNTTNQITALIGSASGGSATISLANAYTFNKIAVAYQNDNAKIFANGVLEATITGITMPTGLNQLDFDIDDVLPFYGKTKQVLYFPTALTDEELEALTTL